MKAIILVGGEGTRLRPLTCNIPKPMVPIVNRPFLEHMLAYLRGHGINDIILASCYLPNRIQDHFGDGRDFGVHLTYVMEESPLGTAGAVKNVSKHLDGTFAVFNGDVFTDLDLTSMIDFHRHKGGKATIALTPVEDPTIYGVVETDGSSRVQRFIEKPSWDAVTTNMINAGTYLLEPDVLHYIPSKTFYMFEQGLFPTLLRKGEPIYGYHGKGYWIDIGTPDKYLLVHHDLLTGKATSRALNNINCNSVNVASESQIDPTAQLKGPVVIGPGCSIGSGAKLVGPVVLGEGCTVQPDAVIEEAIIWRDAQVGKGTLLRQCVIGEKANVGEGSWVVDGSILGDSSNVGSGNKLERGIKVWPGKTIEAHTLTF